MGIPGAIVSLLIPGRISYDKAFGVGDTATRVPMLVDDHTRIGSVTKTFTGTAILQLVDQGKIRLTDPISRYVDGVPSGDVITVLLGMVITKVTGLSHSAAARHPGATRQQGNRRRARRRLRLCHLRCAQLDWPQRRHPRLCDGAGVSTRARCNPRGFREFRYTRNAFGGTNRLRRDVHRNARESLPARAQAAGVTARSGRLTGARPRNGGVPQSPSCG